jgi:hypothetical protein
MDVPRMEFVRAGSLEELRAKGQLVRTAVIVRFL